MQGIKLTTGNTLDWETVITLGIANGRVPFMFFTFLFLASNFILSLTKFHKITIRQTDRYRNKKADFRCFPAKEDACCGKKDDLFSLEQKRKYVYTNKKHFTPRVSSSWIAARTSFMSRAVSEVGHCAAWEDFVSSCVNSFKSLHIALRFFFFFNFMLIKKFPIYIE